MAFFFLDKFHKSKKKKQHWGKKIKTFEDFVKQQLLEVRCQSGPGLGLRLGQQPWIRTRQKIRNFSANSNNFFVCLFVFFS